MSTTIKGAEELLQVLDEYTQVVPEAVAEAVSEEAQRVFEESQGEVPVDTGDLRASGHLEVEVDGSFVQAAISYDAPHAAAVHERTWVRHTNGKAKYLSDPIDRSDIAGAIAAKLVGSR